MEVKAVIKEKYLEPEVHVCNHELSLEVKKIISELGEFLAEGIAAKDEDGEQVIIRIKEVISVYAENTKVFIKTTSGTFESASKLYELEEKLPESSFIRISKSELVNMKKIKKLDLGMTGTIKVIMCDGSESFTSRRNVSKLKKAMGV